MSSKRFPLEIKIVHQIFFIFLSLRVFERAFSNQFRRKAHVTGRSVAKARSDTGAQGLVY